MISYGADYRYSNKESSLISPELPDCLKPLAEKIENTFKGQQATQFLINRFSGKNSFLPEHSDNEGEINPSSSIFTISLGATCKTTHKDKSTGAESEHTCNSRSMYSMTRASQDFFTHGINRGQLEEGEVRYSVTIRDTHWKYKNASCYIAASNTKYIVYGEGEGTFGFANPGVKRWAPRVEHIDPSSCVAFPNVIVQVGVNSIKDRNITCSENRTSDKHDHTVGDVFARFYTKVREIRELNPKCNLFVSPVLPTKSTELNAKANLFNFLIARELIDSSCCALPVYGLEDLADRNGFLAREFSNDGDPLHLNRAGSKILARRIKSALTLRKNQGGLNRYFNDAVKGNLLTRPHRPVAHENQVHRQGRVT